jgi:hypothetical protein
LNPPSKDGGSLDGGLLALGFVLGLLGGGIIAMFKAPKRETLQRQLNETGENLRHKLEAVIPADPIAESLAEGKAAAQRRRAELGLPD